MNDRFRIEVLHGGHEPVLELLLGRDPDMAEDRSRQLGEEALDEVEPRAMLRGEGELEPAGRLRGDPSAGLLGDVRGMIVEDQVDRCIGRVGRVEQGEELDEFTAAVTILDQSMDLAGDQVETCVMCSDPTSSEPRSSSTRFARSLACQGSRTGSMAAQLTLWSRRAV